MAQKLVNPGHGVDRTRGSNFDDNEIEEIGAKDNRLQVESELVDSSGDPITPSNPLPVTSSTPIPIHNDMEGLGKVTIGTTAIELAFTGTTETIMITSDISNTGIIYVGKSDVTSAGANAILQLDISQSVEMDYDDSSNAIYAVSDTASQTIIVGTLK